MTSTSTEVVQDNRATTKVVQDTRATSTSTKVIRHTRATSTSTEVVWHTRATILTESFVPAAPFVRPVAPVDLFALVWTGAQSFLSFQARLLSHGIYFAFNAFPNFGGQIPRALTQVFTELKSFFALRTDGTYRRPSYTADCKWNSQSTEWIHKVV